MRPEFLQANKPMKPNIYWRSVTENSSKIYWELGGQTIGIAYCPSGEEVYTAQHIALLTGKDRDKFRRKQKDRALRGDCQYGG